VERSRRATEEADHQLSPHPPTAPRNRSGHRKLGNRGQSVHLGDKGTSKPMLSMDYSSGISPYRFPIINNYVIPIPPPPKSEKNINTVKGATSRGRRLRPTTAPNGLEQLLIRDTGRFYRPQVQSNACVTMIYLGKTVHLSYDLFDYREEVKVYQQHCGGENLCVFRGKLLEGETFQFISRRHFGFPFSLTFYLNGIQVDRLSSCCEYKHRKGTRLGGKHGHFGFINVERSAPCYRCIIAMGLDKKPSPPKKKVADGDQGDLEKEEVKDGPSERSSSREENKDSQPQFSSAAEEAKEHAECREEMEWQPRKGETQETSHGSDKDQKVQVMMVEAYDEDFEADEEKSDEKVNEEGQVDDQMNGMSKSPSDDEKDNLDRGKRNKNSSQKALRASDSEQDESDGYMESDSEGEDKQDKNLAPSSISSSTPYLSENISDSETRRQEGEQDNMDVHSEYESETKSQRGESQETDMEEEEDTNKTEYTTGERTTDAAFGSKMETNLLDTSSLSEKLSPVGSLDVDVREELEADVLVRFRGRSPEPETRGKMASEDEEEGESKSAKEKIAEALGHDQLLSSEPEPSDSSTEDEEEDAVATGDKQEVTDGAALAKKSGGPKPQTVVEQVEQERQMVGKARALEEEEILDQEVPKHTALEKEFLAKNVSLTAKSAGKDQLARKETELEEEAEIQSDVDRVEEGEMYEKVKPSEELKAEGNVKNPQEMLSEHEISDGEETSGGYLLEEEEIEDQSVSGDLTALEETSNWQEGEKEVAETFEMLGTREQMGKKVVEHEVQETAETIQEAPQGDEALETTFVRETEKNMEQTKSERKETLPDQEPGPEGVVKAKPTDSKEEHMEESKDVEIHLGKASFIETESPDLAPDSKVKEIISINEKEVPSEKLVVEDDLIQKVSFDIKESIQEGPCTVEGDLGKTSLEISKMKNTATEDVSATEVIKPHAEEESLDHLGTEMAVLIQEDAMKGQGAIVNAQEEDSACKRHSEGISEEPTVKTMAETKEAVQQDENIVEAVKEKTEQGGRVVMLTSGMTVRERRLRFEKEEFFTDVVPEALPFAAEELIRKEEAKRKEVKGEAEAGEAEKRGMEKEKIKAEGTKRKLAVDADEEDEETQRLVTVKWKMKDEDSESEGEIVSLVTESEGEPTSEMTIMRWQNIVSLEEDITEAKVVPEASAEKETLTGGLNKERSVEKESTVQEEQEETPEETEQTSVYMKVQDEEVTDDEENEDKGSDTDEQVTGEGITLADVEEALLIGIQQFITEVSRLNEEVEDKEEPPLEDLTEEISTQKEPDKEEFLSAVMAEERWEAESRKVDERGIEEPVERNPLERNEGSGKKKTQQEESSEGNRSVTEIIQWSAEPSEGGQH
ncbi:hypothetical protein JRQ81_014766, partial [Phrynocephalus forsythii]